MEANITISILILAISMVIASLIILAVGHWKNKKTQEEQVNGNW